MVWFHLSFVSFHWKLENPSAMSLGSETLNSLLLFQNIFSSCPANRSQLAGVCGCLCTQEAATLTLCKLLVPDSFHDAHPVFGENKKLNSVLHLVVKYSNIKKANQISV